MEMILEMFWISDFLGFRMFGSVLHSTCFSKLFAVLVSILKDP